MSAGAPAPISKLQHRLEVLERQLHHTRQQLDAIVTRQALLGKPEQLRLVHTYKSEGSYPAPVGNTFDIRFLDGALDTWSPGERTATYTERSATGQSVATTFDKRWILPAKTCVAALLNNKWWIVAGPGLSYFGRLNGSLSQGSSASMQVLDYNGTRLIDSSYDMTVYDYFLNASDTALEAKTKVKVDMLFPGRYYVTAAGCDVDSNADTVYQEQLDWLASLLQLLGAGSLSQQQTAQRPAAMQPPLT